MKRESYSYCMQIEFSQDIYSHSFTLKCMPQDTLRQKIIRSDLRIEPDTSFSCGKDGFGNITVYGSAQGCTDVFVVRSEGIAETVNTNREQKAEPSQTGIFRYPTALTVPDDTIRSFSDEHPEWNKKGYDTACSIMHAVHSALIYTSDSTDVSTDAATALKNGRGVCQDYAHVMISLCRLAGMPARYVVGVMDGEGQSHAWCEVCIDEYWYGFDPTNDNEINENYVRFSSGRDFTDCRINHGIFRGNGTQNQKIHVLVEGSEQ